MKIYRSSFLFMIFGAFALVSCDLKPKITSIPDSIGDFISQRYPALLADPETQPEIYNSAVTDYGVYASPELYGSDKDYLVYADIDDYNFTILDDTNIKQTPIKPETSKTGATPQDTSDDYLIIPNYTNRSDVLNSESPNADTVVVVRGDTLYSIAKKYDTTVSDLARVNSLSEPYTLSIGQKLKLRSSASVAQAPDVAKIEPARSVKIEQAKSQVDVQNIKTQQPIKHANMTRVAVQEITVAPGDTLYSLSRKYEIPVNDLAVLNKITSPFVLSVGQKLKVPKKDSVQTQTVKSGGEVKSEPAKGKGASVNKVSVATPVKETQKSKISSDPKKQLPAISARSAAKFSWPIRGKILSQYGAKNGGLFNDGINIAADMGATVKAAENGVVAYAGNEVKGMGNLIIMQHSDGWMTVYAHLDSMSVRRGTKVNVGQPIGKIGKTGKVDKPQLHFEIHKGTKAYNPIQYLKK